jgi:hypothetical protein
MKFILRLLSSALCALSLFMQVKAQPPSAHYPHSEEMMKPANEMGLMVWAEVPV